MNIDRIKQLNPKLDECCAGIGSTLPDNFNKRILVMEKFSPTNEVDCASFALELRDNCSESTSFEPKCWISVNPDGIREVNGQRPKPHDEYLFFSYKGVEFYPYSVNLEEFVKLDQIFDIISSLYEHIQFDQCPI